MINDLARFPREQCLRGRLDSNIDRLLDVSSREWSAVVTLAFWLMRKWYGPSSFREWLSQNKNTPKILGATATSIIYLKVKCVLIMLSGSPLWDVIHFIPYEIRNANGIINASPKSNACASNLCSWNKPWVKQWPIKPWAYPSICVLVWCIQSRTPYYDHGDSDILSVPISYVICGEHM